MDFYLRNICKIFILMALYLLPATNYAQNYAGESVLSSGKWYKLGITENGIYQLTYNDLIEMGIDPHSVNPKKIGLFGNMAGMLPEKNSLSNYDDLSEISILVDGEDDGKFDENDAVIFYGQSPVTWKYTADNLYSYNCNYYTDTTYYFLRVDCDNNGARMSERDNIQGLTSNDITEFKDYQYHDVDLHNYYKQGRRWYGEEISGETTKRMSFPFTFKNAIGNMQGYAVFNLVGASKSEVFFVNIYINGERVWDNIRVSKASDHVFGYEIDKKNYFMMTDDVANIEIEIVSTNATSLVGVDYLSVNAWRKLRYEDENLSFGIVTEQFSANLNRVKIENANEDMLLLDVSNPLNPVIQHADYYDKDLSFNVYPDALKSFFLTEKDNYRPVLSAKRIDNQNLHAINDAEMLIITHPLFREQAGELADFHIERDGLNCVVVDIDDVWNEFSSGTIDITGIRNFIRMVYQRSSDLKFVLLYGDATCDYKNVLGYGNNFIPSYEAISSYKELESFVCDDYYALMDFLEGDNCTGNLNLSIGRLPVSSVYEAEVALDKIKHYSEMSRAVIGGWRNNILYVADDNSKEYPKNCESYVKIVETSCQSININKVYEDAYVRQKITDSYVYPDASADLVSKLEEGQLIMTYIGHGGIKGLTDESLFTEAHINALKNYDRLAFVVTGTCEFSKFDNPSYQSAGEQLFMNPRGGAVAMFTTTRPTQSSSNYSIVKGLHEALLKYDGMRNKYLGEMVTETKNGSGANLYYVFLGDPALRLAYPQEDVVLTEINGQINDFYCVVGAMGTLDIKGVIRDAAGNTDTLFNGYLYPKLFDNESDYQTLNNVGSSYNILDFKYYDNVLYEGKITVTNGHFQFSVKIPRSTNYQDNMARISCYAIDTVRMIDANGSNESIKIQGVDPETVVDNQGPEILMSWEGNGNDGILTVLVQDPQGIYHYDATIGRSIMLTHKAMNINEVSNINDLFEPAIDDITQGIMTVKFSSLSGGEHIFSVRAWDLHDNSSEKSISVIVNKASQDNLLENVLNYPNPFNDGTNFHFSFGDYDVHFDMTIDIYDVIGRHVVSLSYPNLDNTTSSVFWNGCDASGNHLPSGIYVYRLQISDENGNDYVTNQRMVVNK